MNGWIILWITVLFAALTLFTGLTVVVTIGGLLDIRKMLHQLRRQHDKDQDDARQAPIDTRSSE